MKFQMKQLPCLLFLFFCFLVQTSSAQLRFSHRENPIVKQIQQLFDDQYDDEMFSVINKFPTLQKKDAQDLLVWAALDLPPSFKTEFYKRALKVASPLIEEYSNVVPSNDEEIFRQQIVKYATALSKNDFKGLSSATKVLKSHYDKGWKPLYRAVAYGMYADYLLQTGTWTLDEVAHFIVSNTLRSDLAADHLFVITDFIGEKQEANSTQYARRQQYTMAILEKFASVRLDLFPDFLTFLWGRAHLIASDEDLIKTRKSYIYSLNSMLSTLGITYPKSSPIIKEINILYRIFHERDANQEALVNELITLTGNKELALNKIVKYFNSLPYDGAIELLASRTITWDKPFKDLLLKLKDQDMFIVFRYSNFLSDYLMANDVSDGLVATIMHREVNSSISGMVDNSDVGEFNANYLNERLSIVVDKIAMIRKLPKYKDSAELPLVSLSADLSYHVNYLVTNNVPSTRIRDLITAISNLTSEQVGKLGQLFEVYYSDFSDLQKEYKSKFTSQQDAELTKLIQLLKAKSSL